MSAPLVVCKWTLIHDDDDDDDNQQPTLSQRNRRVENAVKTANHLNDESQRMRGGESTQRLDNDVRSKHFVYDVVYCSPAITVKDNSHDSSAAC